MEEKFDHDLPHIDHMFVKKRKKRETHKLIIIDEEELIRQVELRPILYDKSLKGYRKTGIREQAWKDIASILESTVEECRKRWRSLRDAFSKHYKQVENLMISKKKKWLFYDQMFFIAAYLDNPSIQSTAIEENSHESIMLTEEENIREIEEENTFNKSDNVQDDPQQCEEQINIYDDGHVMRGIFENSNSFQQNELKKDDINEDFTRINSIDSDERFLLSCLPILKRISDKQNALARLKIQQILFNIEFGDPS